MKVSKSYNPKSRQLTSSFPKWSAAYADPNSDANRLLNPFANSIEYLENINEDIQEDAILFRTDIHKHPHKRWTVDERDVLDYDTSLYASKELYIHSISNIIGIIGETQIALIEVDNEVDFYTPEMQTGWYVTDSLEHTTSGIISSCEVIGQYLYINVLENDEQKDPGVIEQYRVPHSWVSNINKDNNLTFINIFEDIVYETVQLTFNITDFNYRVVLNHQLKDQETKLEVIDILTSNASGEIILTNDYQFVDTSDYDVRDVYVGDLDDDSIIDEREIQIITDNLNKTIDDFEDKDLFRKYDLNGDGIINGSELNIINAVLHTIQNNVSAIIFNNPGKYQVSYKIPNNNQGASRSIYSRDGILTSLQSYSYGYLEPDWPEGYVDATWDQDKRITYYLDNNTKSVWAYETDILGNTLDRYKIQLPLISNMKLSGICYSRYRIYILCFSDSKPYIYTIRTDIDDFENHIQKIEIHSGNSSTGLYTIERDGYGISSNAVGLSIIQHNKLITIDENQVKLLVPLYDYYYKSTDVDGKLSIHFRENYDTYTPFPSGIISPIYQELWNALNIHGEEKGLPRIPGETNESYKARILDVFEHFPDRSKQGTLYGIQRELGLPIEDIYIPKQVNILPAPITKENVDSVNIFDDTQKVEVDEVSISNEYRYGKYSHDKIVFIASGVPIITVNRDIIE